MATVAVAQRERPGVPLVRPVTDRALLRRFLERDRLYAAYAICDLDDQEFGRTRWNVAFEREDAVALALEYSGPSPQPLFLMGEPRGVEAILRQAVRLRTAYVAARVEHLPAVATQYRVDPGPLMVRMWVDRAHFRPFPDDVQRLLPVEAGDLNRLYGLGFAAWLPSSAITEGVYYGIRVRGRLVAAAGTHVISPAARLGVVGNVMTHADFRGRGYATAVTGAVTAELLRRCDQVVLNVRADNAPALAAYRRLGYQEHVRFEERLVHRLAPAWSGWTAPLRRLFSSRKGSPSP
ncbi:MAG TPA: GNAT family N-acetyltransferase [Candidatus Limnocylindrales bacterium]